MKMTIEITEGKSIKVANFSGFYLIVPTNDKYRIYRRYTEDSMIYYVDCVDNIIDALINVNKGYIEIF